eukprot:2903592-Pleurochrysis_carterae.AAC.1
MSPQSAPGQRQFCQSAARRRARAGDCASALSASAFSSPRRSLRSFCRNPAPLAPHLLASPRSLAPCGSCACS